MGRRALASALDLAGELIYEQQSEARKRRQRAAELEQEYAERRKLKEYEMVLEGKASYDPQTGVFTRTPFQVPAGMEPYQTTDPGTGTIYRRPEAQMGALDIPIDTQSQSPGLFNRLGGAIKGLFNRSPVTPETTQKISTPNEERLPDASDYLEGDEITSDETGRSYRVVGGEWQPI